MFCTEVNDVSNPDEKICLWALMVTIKVLQSANCQFFNFLNLEKGLLGTVPKGINNNY